MPWPWHKSSSDTAAPSTDIPVEEWLWAVGSMASIHQLPFDERLTLASSVPPYEFAQLQPCLQQLGLRCTLSTTLPRRSAWKVPAIVQLHQVAGDPAKEQSTHQIALLAKTDDDGIWLFYPGKPEPRHLPFDQLAGHLTGRVLACTRAVATVRDPDAPERLPFGFRWFVPQLLRHKGIWRDVLGASLVLQLIALATPLFTQAIIDKVVVHQTTSTLIVIGVALGIFTVFNALLTWIRQYLVLHTGNRIDAHLGHTVFDHLFRLPLRYFEHRPTGVIAARMHAVETIREFVASSLVTLVLDLPFLLIFVGVMFYYSVPLTLLVLALLALIALLSALVAPMLQQRLNEQFILGARNQAFLTEFVSGLETVKSLQMEPQLVRRYREYLGSYLSAGFRTRQIGNTYSVAANMLEQLMTLLVLVLGAWIVMNRTSETAEPFTIGMLVAFQMFAGKLSQPLLRLVGLWQQFQQASLSVKRLADIMDAPAEPYAVAPSRETRHTGLIEIDSLAFRYATNRPFLYQNLSLAVQPGTTAVIVGPSGSGKSTLAKLLQGFYQPTSGQIRLDGADIQHLAANELRTYFGVVPQETTLFSGTIFDNLAMANPHASFDQIVQACKMAEVHRVIEQLPQGYQTEIGERGAGLSGGQKQRLAIARALLKRPRVLIFDEATSALDTETAEHFAHTVNALHGKVSMLFITHQMPRNLRVDQVIHIGGRAAPAPVAAKCEQAPSMECHPGSQGEPG